MKSQRQRGWDVHRQLNHPVDLEMLELPRLRRKTKSLKKCMDDLSLSSDVQDSLDLFSDGDHKKKKKKKKDKEKKDKKEKPKKPGKHQEKKKKT